MRLTENSVADGNKPVTTRVQSIPSVIIEKPERKSDQSFFSRFLDSFRRGENLDALNKEGHDTSRLSRKLKGRHMQMIAIGGAIGTGLFVGSGSALATGGPAALLVGFGSIGIMLFCVIHALGELAVMFPIAGTFQTHRGVCINRRLLFDLLYPFHRPGLGVCHGLELRDGVACHPPSRAHCCRHHGRLLEIWYQCGRVYHNISHFDCFHQSLGS